MHFSILIIDKQLEETRGGPGDSDERMEGRLVLDRRDVPGWAEYAPYEEEPFLWRGPETYDPLVVYQPRTWLLRDGWRKGGATISTREVPSAKR